MIAIALPAKITVMAGTPSTIEGLPLGCLVLLIYASCELAMIRSYLSAASDW